MMDFGIAKLLLLEIKDLLDSLCLPFFLSHGTALGVYRDGWFTPQEDDIDIGFLAEDFVPMSGELAKSLTDRGFQLITLVEPFEKCWAIKARKSGIGIDLVSFIRWQDQVWGDDGRFCPSTLADFSGFYPSPILENTEGVWAFNRLWQVPSPIEEYLELEYGETWRIPSSLHAYTTFSKTRIDGFMSTRGVRSDLLSLLN